MKLVLKIVFLLLFLGCKSSKLPTKKYSQYDYHTSYSHERKQNVLSIKLGNPLNCPLRVWMFHPDKALQNKFNELNPVLLNSVSDTVLNIPNVFNFEKNIRFSSRLGSVSKKVQDVSIALPFPSGHQYKVVQGNNTNHTHSSDWSRYAVDLDLKVNDTICAATKGFVVGVVDQYKYGGVGKEWRPYGNFITIYEPKSGVFTQYAHLIEKGSLVTIGDKVESGQPIALSGKTGQTDVAHLHFNCLVPVHSDDGLTSIPFEFVEGYKSEELNKNDTLVKE